MDGWWAPRRQSFYTGRVQGITVLLIGPKRYGNPVLIGSDGREREMHPLQYTHAWRRFYRYMPEGAALVITDDGVWPVTAREVGEHVASATGALVRLSPAQKAQLLERTLVRARLFGGPPQLASARID